jgi:hypothetical protein
MDIDFVSRDDRQVIELIKRVYALKDESLIEKLIWKVHPTGRWLFALLELAFDLLWKFIEKNETSIAISLPSFAWTTAPNFEQFFSRYFSLSNLNLSRLFAQDGQQSESRC